MRDGTVQLASGRRLGYAHYGVDDGLPVLEFHGVPGSRAYQLRDDALEKAGVKLLTIERPGFGLSDPQPGRTLADWPRDVAEFADAADIGRFAVVGVSAGGPYAMACAHALGDRVTVAGLVCAVGPAFDAPQFDGLRSAEIKALLEFARGDIAAAPAVVREVLRPTADAVSADPAAYFDDVFLGGWSETDRPRFVAERDRWILNLEATYGSGVDTIADDAVIVYGPWGFDLAEVRVPVRAWHGALDDVPLDAVRHVIDNVPDGKLTVYPGEAHYLSESHHDDWLAALTSPSASA
jgi:pimeloyl-ACP methyl ester carboxylesterase